MIRITLCVSRMAGRTLDGPEGLATKTLRPLASLSARFNRMDHACLGRISESRQRLIRVLVLRMTACNKEQINEHGA